MNKLSEILNIKTRIDTNNWQPFKVSNLFSKPKIKKVQKIPITPGTIALITSQSTNNGIAKKCYLNQDFLNNAITVSTNGNNFDCFYHDYNFFPGTDVEVLINSKLNKYNAIFLCSILHKESDKYSFGKKAKNNAVWDTIIKLPVDSSGNPDWQFMEEFVRERERDVQKTLINLQHITYKKNKLDINNWQEFLIGDLFDISRGSRILRTKDYKTNKDELNNYRVITPKLTNNGIDGYYSRFNCEGNCLVVGGDVSGLLGFYQNQKCWVLDTCRIISSKNINLSKNMYMFILCQIQKWNYYFSFQRKANPDDIKKLIIKLPVDSSGNPDWQFMEEFIKSKEDKLNRQLNQLYYSL